jgi:acetyl esterase/lipase
VSVRVSVSDVHPVPSSRRRAGLRLAAALAALPGLGTLAGCSVGSLLAALTPGGGSLRLTGERYGDDPRQGLDVFLPASVVAAPVVMFFYGGSWNSGNRDAYRFVGEALAARGCLVVIPDYRVYPQVRYPTFLEDCAAATGWTMRNLQRLGGDPARLILLGHSAGAYNAAMLALDRRWLDAPRAHGPLGRLRPAAWIGLAGPYDFLPVGNPDVKPVFFHPAYPPGTQPIDYARAGSPPCLLAAADDDDLVDPGRNTRQLAAKLRAAGIDVEEHHYDGVGHMTLLGAFAGPLRWQAPVYEDVVRFIGRH